MSAIPGDVDPDRQPPMTVPLRHFLVASTFLPLGVLVGVAADLLDLVPAVSAIGGFLVLVGTLLFVVNVAGVVRAHAPQSLATVLFGTWAPVSRGDLDRVEGD